MLKKTPLTRVTKIKPKKIGDNVIVFKKAPTRRVSKNKLSEASVLGGAPQRFSFIVKFFFPKNPLLVILNSLILTGFFSFTIFVFASYNPGDTLDPACNPTDPSCVITSPVATITGTQLDNVFTGTSGLLKKTSAGTYTLDASNYLTSFTETDPIFISSVSHGILSSDISNWNTSFSNASQALGTGSTPTFLGLSLGSSGLNTTGTGIFNNLKLNSGGALQTGTNSGDTLLFNVYNTGSSTYNNFATLTAGATPTMNLASGVTIGGNSILNSSLANVANGYLGLNSSGNFDASSGTVLFNGDVYSSSSITWQHPRDPAELSGNSTYSYSSGGVMGMYEYMSSTNTTSVSSILANVWCTNTSRDVSFKIFASTSASAFNPDSATPLYSGTISHTIMPHASVPAGSTFALTSPVTVPAGNYLFVVWESTSASELKVTLFTTDASSAPYRHGFIFGSQNAVFTISSVGSGFAAATFRVYGVSSISKQFAYSGTNLISNPGFESGLWGSNSTSGTDETVLVHSGSHAEKLLSTNTNWYTPQAEETITVIGGQKYQLTFWTRGDGTHDGTYSVFDATNSAFIVAAGTHTGISGTTYAQYTTIITMPAGCTSINLWLAVTQASGAVAYFDDVSLVQGTYTSVPISVQTLLNNLPSSAISFSDPNGILQSTNVQAGIIEAYNHAATLNAVVPRIVLPDTLYAVVGDELQLFVRGMIEAQNPYDLPYSIDSTVGNSYPRYFDYTPVIGDVGTKTVTVNVLNYDYSVLSTKSVNLVVSNPTGQPTAAKNILTLGDSLTGGGTWPAELYRRLTQSGGTPAGLGYGNINFIGDIALPGFTTQGYDAWGGWAYSTYTDTVNTAGHTLTGTFDKDSTDAGSTYTDGTNTWSIIYAKSGNILKIGTYGGAGSATLAASGTLTWVSGGTHHSNIVYTAKTNEPISPFWDSANSRFDFTAFTSRTGASSIDAVYVLLSWNNIFTSNMTTFSYLTNTRTFLNQLHTDYPNAIVRLIGVEIPSVNGGLGANYGSAGDAEYYGMVKTVNNNNIALQNLANEAAYSSWVKFISVAPQFDSENNMSQSLTAVNTRNSATEYRGTNGVHPATQGYYQIADAVFREFINMFCSH